MLVSADPVKGCAVAMHLKIQSTLYQRACVSLCKCARFRDEVMDGTVNESLA